MTFPPELKGWLLSVYPDEVDGAVVWILGDDGKRYRLSQPFPTTFYLSGEQRKIRGIRDDLQKLDPPPKTAFVSQAGFVSGHAAGANDPDG